MDRSLFKELERLASISSCRVKEKGDRITITDKNQSYSIDNLHPRAAQAFLRSRIRSDQLAGSAAKIRKARKNIES